MLKTIVIVGGGTAGWLCAGILAADFKAQGNQAPKITLIESPDIATIGVGEGTWPTMRTTLKRIGISEAEFLTTCNASFKQGSKFVGWRNGDQGDSYYHPFTEPFAHAKSNSVAVWQQHFAHMNYDEAMCLQGRSCDDGLAPKQIKTPEYSGVLNYGYHLDAGLFAGLLQRHCVDTLGVRHIADRVVTVDSHQNGNIRAVVTENHGALEGDLFIDCSGSSGLLISEHFGSEWVDWSGISINNRALAVQVPYLSESSAIASATIATAQPHGWVWDIGLASRRGAGYVYSSAHVSDEIAEQEFRQYLKSTVDGSVVADLSVRKLQFKAGHRKHFWLKNCVAMGMAAGFIEPLEASALALVELSANFIRDEFPFGENSIEVVGKHFNRLFTYRWQRIIEFLKLHYVLSERRDTDYWREVTNLDTAPAGLREQLELWQHRPPYYRDLLHTEEIFPAASYQYVLFGMGFKADQYPPRATDSVDSALPIVADGLAKWPQLQRALPTNRDLIETIKKYGLPRV